MQRTNHKNIAKVFILSLIVIGLLFGIIYYNLQSELNKSVILTKIQDLPNIIKSTHQNTIIFHLIAIIILVFLAYSIIGMPLILFYLFYECTSLGFLLASFYGSFKLSGILFGIVYLIICKLIYIIFLVYLSYIALKISKKLLRTLVLKENESLYQHLKNMFMKLGIAFVFVLIYDLFLYFCANPILKIFLFLLK